jgi:predicted DNA binding CopG/RHH family protein
VYQPQTAKTHYIVVLGRNLSEDQAEALRRKAVAAGLPRDTYIKRVM